MRSIWCLGFLFLSGKVTANLFNSVFHLAVTSGARNRPKGDAVVEFDEFGGLPQLENTYHAVNKASTVIALRTENASLLSFTTQNSSGLQVAIGAQPLNALINSRQYLLATGLAGDIRCVVRHAKQVVLNHTVAFDMAPTGGYIAHEMGKFLQEYTVRGGIRPLACHVFIADSLIEKSLYEVDAAGNVAQIWAGVGGKHMVEGRNILESSLNGTFISSIEVATEIAEKILQLSIDSKDIKEKASDDADKKDDEEYNKPNVDLQTVHFPVFDRD
jgi:20S proteasome alpha/beta subunit